MPPLSLIPGCGPRDAADPAGTTGLSPVRPHRAWHRASPWWAAGLLVFVLEASPAAIGSLDILNEYRLTSWGPGDGLISGGINALAQDAAGYLWLGTETGLVRFDGVRFTPWKSFGATQLPNVPIRTLCAGRDGSLWIGFGFSRGVSRLYAGQVVNYAERNELPAIDVSALAEDRRGVIWAGTSHGLFRFAGGRWEPWPEDHGLPAGPVFSAGVDSRGALFIGTSWGVFSLPEGEDTFDQVNILEDNIEAAQYFRSFGGDALRTIIEDHTGVLWVTDPTVGFRRGDRRGPPRRSARGSALARDGKGNVWVGTWDEGLWRVRAGAGEGSTFTVDRMTAASGLVGDSVRSLLEDRDGNLWVGTLDGLNRLSPYKVTSFRTLGLVNAVGVRPDGSIWVGSANGLMEHRDGLFYKYEALHTLAPTLLTAVDADDLGNVWASTRSDLLLIPAGAREPVKVEGLGGLAQIRLIASDKHGGCWLYDLDRGLLRWRDGRLEIPPLPTELRSPRTVAMYVDRQARLWVSLTDGRLATIDADDNIVVHGLVSDIGVYRAMYQDERGAVWLGASGGVTRFQDGRFATLRRTDAFPADSVAGIIDDATGAMWLGTASGIVRILRDDFDQALASPISWVRHSFYDTSDGLAGTPRWFGKRSAARAPDGRLWFVTSGGLTIIDPRVLPVSRPSSRVDIEAVVVDGQRLAAEPRMSLPAGTGRFVVNYEVPSLTSALKMRFRYRLDGFDHDWNYAGAARSASYTNVPPGNYRFRVAAGDSEGAWGEPGAGLSLSIEPWFYQTRWFIALCVIGVVAAIATAWRLHLGRLRKQFAIVLGERLRLSREIHDTLLQSLIGVALQCDDLANELGPTTSPRAGERFTQLRRDVEDHVREARQTIWNLRSPVLEQHGLATAIEAAGHQATSGSKVKFEMAVTGSPRRISTDAEGQLLRIGQEAIVNAVRHAAAEHVRTELLFGDEFVSLRVEDDGVGFVLEQVVGNGDGHYGLVSMRERAQTVGGRFAIVSGPGRGTAVEVLVRAPASSTRETHGSVIS